VLARVSTRPGQHGRSDGVVLEGAELQFYMKKLDSKKKK
jgi:small subunit ribosomal protein S8e